MRDELGDWFFVCIMLVFIEICYENSGYEVVLKFMK